MPSPLGGYIDPSQPRNSVESLITDIFQRHGLIGLTDVEQVNPYAGTGPLGLSLDAEAIAELRADKEKWDDTPAPEKLINLFFSMAARPKKDRPDPTIIRLVGTVPATGRAVIIVVYSFTPIAVADISDLRKVGRWTMAVRDERGNPTVFAGDIHDHEELKGALEVVTAICAKHKEALRLDSLVPSMLDGAMYRDAPAYPRGRRGVILAGGGELAGAASGPTPEQILKLTPEQIAALRQTAIRTGAFEEFLEALPDQPPMTTDEIEASMRQQIVAAIDESDAPPIPLTPP